MQESLEKQLQIANLGLQKGLLQASGMAESLRRWKTSGSESLLHWLEAVGGLAKSQIDTLRRELETAKTESLLDAPTAENTAPLPNDLAATNPNIAETTDPGISSKESDGSSLQTVEFSDASGSTGSSKAMPQKTSLVDTGRFRVVREHAKGGLGVVFLAEDRELGRTVALKQIRKDRASIDVYQAKFTLEAEITGQLEHPGIVPVYSFGADRHGRPFYAMRFIQGEEFTAAIRRFHAARIDQRESYDGLEFRRLIRRFTDVCHAIDFAHAKGILHRDLKPSNVILGAFGETLVVDWGLAKQFESDANETGVQASPSLEKTKRRGSTRGTETRIGTFTGTVQYASPEQLLGQLHLMNPSSDVYSLGAILFEIITNRPPIAAEDKFSSVQEVAQRIREGKIPSPATIVSGVPKPLVAICRLAMAGEQSERYTSARLLADDLERWMGDERVQAYGDREPVLEMFGRVMRRYRSWTIPVATSIVVVAGCATGAAILVNRARVSEQQAKVAAQEYKSDAVERFGIAKEAIDSLLVGSTDTLADLPATQDLRKKLLKLAARDYERLSQGDSQDPELEIERVRALVRLADIHHLQFDYEAAHRQYDEAAKALADLRERLKDNSGQLLIRCRVEQAKVDHRIGLAYDLENRIDEAKRAFAQAVDSLRSLTNSNSGNSEVAFALASALANQANLFSRVGLDGDAIKGLEESIAIYSKQDLSDQPRQSLALGRTQELLGRALTFQGRFEEASKSFDESKKRLSSLILLDVSETSYLEALASVYVSDADLQRVQGLNAESKQSLSQAVDVYQKLRSEWPDDLRFVEYSAITRADIGLIEFDAGEFLAAEKELRLAVQEFQSLVESYPKVPSFREGLATALDGLGQVLMVLQESPDEALKSFEQSISFSSGLARESQDPPPYVAKTAVAISHYAQLLADKGRSEEAQSNFESSLSLLRELAKPNDNAAVNRLAHCLYHYGRHQTRLGQTEQARTSFTEALELWKQIQSARPSADTAYQIAKLRLRCPDATLRNNEEAVSFAKYARDGASRNARFAGLYAEALLAIGNVELSEKELESTKSVRGNWQADDYATASLIANRKGDKAKALEALTSAKQWAQENCPHHVETRERLAEIEKLLSGE